MDNIFQYAFMQRAFVVAAIIAVIAPCIGVSIVLKRLSAIGDATSHSALAGIAFGLLLGINPILGAVMFSIFAVIGIEVFRKSFGIIDKKTEISYNSKVCCVPLVFIRHTGVYRGETGIPTRACRFLPASCIRREVFS